MNQFSEDSKDDRRMEAIAKTRQELAPVIKDLQQAGYKFNSLDDLRDSGLKYQSAIPILLFWLPQVPSPDSKESIVRALSVPWAKPAAGPVLLGEFEKAPKHAELLRWAIGNALEVVAEPSLASKIIELVKDKDNGSARDMAVLALGKIRQPKVIEALIELLDDEEVAGHAIMALRKLKAVESLDYLVPVTKPSLIES
jgi:hypothetical protein